MAKVETKKENSRFVAKVQQKIFDDGGIAQSIRVDNPYQNKKDGSPDPYHKGNLLWYDRETDQVYTIKELKISTPRTGMPERQVELGFVANVILELDNPYHVEIKTEG